MNPHVVFSVRVHTEKNKADLAFKKRSGETREVVFQGKQKRLGLLKDSRWQEGSVHAGS